MLFSSSEEEDRRLTLRTRGIFGSWPRESSLPTVSSIPSCPVYYLEYIVKIIAASQGHDVGGQQQKIGVRVSNGQSLRVYNSRSPHAYIS